MDDLYLKSAYYTQYAYDHNVDLGTTEYNVMNFEGYQFLSIPGTNEFKDWFKNANLWSKKGIKKSAYDAAIEIDKVFKRSNKLLVVTGHSKGAAEAVAYTKLFGAYRCIIFNPARCLRYWSDRNMDNTTMFIDPDDPVSKVGLISFGLPKCKIIKAKDDHFLPSVKDHFMDNWISYIKDMH